jgi:hypothetical protein
MSEQERLDRFDRAMTHLIQAHREALEACGRVLDERDEPPVGDVVVDLPGGFAPLDNPASRSEEGWLYREALEEVRIILVSASEDLQLILGEGNEGG